MADSGGGDPIEPMWRAGCDAWPGVELSLEHFRGHVEGLLGDDGLTAAPLHGSDLFLACACASGDPAALRAFEQHILPATTPALRRLDSSPAFADEVRQRVRERLFVAEPGGAPRIAAYAGRGPLATWVRVTAVRTALNLRGSRDREAPTTESQLAAIAPAVDDPSLRHLKERFAVEFRAALARACEKLADRDRTVLRLRFIDELNIDQIGAIYAVHRATVARWIARIRDELFAGTREELRAVLKLDDDEFDSLLRLAHSQLDLSISAVLGPAAD
jgi:RNA polymerase sigma-70 factor, ECF subfamily